jgi:hypothetical protein
MSVFYEKTKLHLKAALPNVCQNGHLAVNFRVLTQKWTFYGHMPVNYVFTTQAPATLMSKPS